MAEVKSPRDLGYTQQRNANGTFGRYGGQGNINSLYYYPAGEPRAVTNQRTGERRYGSAGQAMIDSNISGAGRNSDRRRNRGVQNMRLRCFFSLQILSPKTQIFTTTIKSAYYIKNFSEKFN